MRVLRFFPILDFIQKPVNEGFNSFAGFGADGEDYGFGVALADVFAASVKVEVEIGHHIGLVDEYHIAHCEHQRVLQWLVVAFGHRENHGVAHRSSIELGGTDQVSHVFLNDEVVVAMDRI